MLEPISIFPHTLEGKASQPHPLKKSHSYFLFKVQCVPRRQISLIFVLPFMGFSPPPQVCISVGKPVIFKNAILLGFTTCCGHIRVLAVYRPPKFNQIGRVVTN